jgi:hypothetical protein
MLQIEAKISTEEKVQNNRRKREKLLNKLYESYMSGKKYVSIDELNAELAFDDTVTRKILRFYTYKRFIEVPLGGPIKITYAGIKGVELNRENRRFIV